MQDWKIDVPVLLIFFVRSEPLEKVFAAIRQAKPSTLLLWQDGPRKDHPEDAAQIARCREIVNQIDWDCTVYRKYNEENFGCDPSTFYSHKWAFSLVDKCIILEDDRVPVQGFFRYCKELLDRYEFDDRISHICGTNLLGTYENCPDDYFFAPFGSTTWATWKRIADEWDESYADLNSDYALRSLKRLYGKGFYKSFHEAAFRHKNSGVSYWETILGLGALMHSRAAIIPKKNMITDIGLTENATHANAHPECLPKKLKKMFYMESYDPAFPLKHPSQMVIDLNYADELSKINGICHPWLQIGRKLTYYYKCVLHGQFGLLLSGIKRRLHKK